jgi:hypothetical protein
MHRAFRQPKAAAAFAGIDPSTGSPLSSWTAHCHLQSASTNHHCRDRSRIPSCVTSFFCWQERSTASAMIGARGFVVRSQAHVSQQRGSQTTAVLEAGVAPHRQAGAGEARAGRNAGSKVMVLPSRNWEEPLLFRFAGSPLEAVVPLVCAAGGVAAFSGLGGCVGPALLHSRGGEGRGCSRAVHERLRPRLPYTKPYASATSTPDERWRGRQKGVRVGRRSPGFVAPCCTDWPSCKHSLGTRGSAAAVRRARTSGDVAQRHGQDVGREERSDGDGRPHCGRRARGEEVWAAEQAQVPTGW